MLGLLRLQVRASPYYCYIGADGTNWLQQSTKSASLTHTVIAIKMMGMRCTLGSNWPDMTASSDCTITCSR